MPYRTDIPGQVSVEQLEAISLVAPLVPANGKVVEVGSLFGRSSYAWAASVDPSVTVYCIDPWERNVGVRALEKKHSVRYGLEQFLTYTQDLPNIVAIKGRSPDVAHAWNDEIELYYEDAVHTNPVLSKNIEFWTSKLNKNGICCGDDFRPRFPDVVEAAKRVAERTKRKLLTVEFFWCVLPKESELPGAGEVAARLEEMSAAVREAKRKEVFRFSVGPSTLSRTPSETLQLTTRITNETLRDWPNSPGNNNLQLDIRLGGHLESIDLGTAVLKGDIPVPVTADFKGVKDTEPAVEFELRKSEGSKPLLLPAPKTLKVQQAGAPNDLLDDPKYEAVIEVVLADRNWILERLGKEIQSAARSARAKLTVELVDSPSGEADLTYFLPYSIQTKLKHSIVGSWFTHREASGEAAKAFIDHARDADFCVTPARKYQRLLAKHDIRNVSVVYHGVDLETYVPRLRLGIVGRTYHTGRKGEDLLSTLTTLEGVELVFAGDGWPLPSALSSHSELPSFYNSIDYLLIPSRIEGGPVPLFEALACGCPVIASDDVGCVEDFPHISFENGNRHSLETTVRRLLAEKTKLRDEVSELTWERFGREHLQIFLREISRSKKPSKRRQSRSKPSSVHLVTHGSETANKGGPTTRVALINERLTDTNTMVSHVRADKTTTSKMRRDIVHVFNSWPLHTSVEALEFAQETATRVVYSPIALNLSARPVFQDIVPEVLRSSKSASECERALESLQTQTVPWGGVGRPAEGIAGHHRSLRRSLQLADHVIYLSEYEQRFLNSIGATPQSGTVVRNGIETSVFRNGDPAAFQERFGLRDFVLMVGRIETRKNQAAVALALRELQVPVVAIGGVGDHEYLALASRWAGRNFVRIERIEDRSLLASAYKAAVCTILTSWSEGAPLVAVEAGAAGSPLVLSGMSAEREYFGDYAQYLHPLDLDGLRATVSEAIESPEPEGVREARSDFVCKRYDIQRHVDETQQVYSSTLQRPRSAQSDAKGNDRSNERVVIDVTHWAHDAWNDLPLTGVTSVERSIARAALKSSHDVQFVVWNSPNRKYYDVDEQFVLDGSFYVFANQRHQSALPAPGNGYRAEASPRPFLSGRRPASESNFSGLKRVVLELARSDGRVRLQEKIEDKVVVSGAQIGQRLPEGFRKPLAKAALKSRLALRNLREHKQIRSGLSFIPAADQLPSGGERLFVFGQPWISNDRQLDDLLKYVDETSRDLVCLIHDILYITDQRSFPSRTRETYRRRLRRLLQRTHTAVVTSKQTEQDLRDFVAVEGHRCAIHRIQLGMPDNRLKLERSSPDLERPFVLYVSSMNQRKNHDFLVSVWKDVRTMLKRNGHRQKIPELVLAGNPQSGFEHYGTLKFINELRRHGIVVRNGLSHVEINELYRRCLFTVYPSLSEGWGLPPMESLQAGKVCLASRDIPSVAETESPGLIPLPPQDHFAWVKTISAFVERPHMRKAFESDARPPELATWDQTFQQLVEEIQ